MAEEVGLGVEGVYSWVLSVGMPFHILTEH